MNETVRNPDRRLDAYRERAGVLTDADGRDVGLLYLQVMSEWTQVGGALWWRRWSPPHEAVHGFVLVGDQFGDWVMGADELDDTIREWESGIDTYMGTTYGVRWLDDEASAVVRVDDFGLDVLGG